ncbi:hypothetical protein OUZ56_011412 [Daphnia magna]|uniref:Uncharacterized protein n=1 Tax=Daphnia magna TaxID=35525 RepID=A0ABQ9Z024_9CRUS|nr:hypothetical protein OUZ56_011412 [Daphnia magna]
MKDMAATCARTGRIWPHTILWAHRESTECALHYERLRAAQGRRDAHGEAPVIQGQELDDLMGGVAPAQLEFDGFYGPQDQAPELNNVGFPELDAPVPDFEVIYKQQSLLLVVIYKLK